MPRDLRGPTLLLRRNGASWEWAVVGGSWRPLEGSEGMIDPEAIVALCDLRGQPVKRTPEHDV